MSLSPEPISDVPELTARVAHTAFPKWNRYLTIRDELKTIYTNEQFADLYPNVGQYAIPAWRLALITIVQFAEKLTDREIADAVRSRIDLKYLLGLELEDAGFDFSILSEFRSRLLAGSAEERLLNVLLAYCQKQKWLKAGGKQRTDSTHIQGAVRELNRLEIVGETLHHVLNILAQVDPDWLRHQITDDWFERYGQRFSDYRLPKAKGNRTKLAEKIGQDGYHLLCQIYADQSPKYLRQILAIDIMHQVWIQHYYIEDDKINWREQKNFLRSGLMIASPYDEEIRYSHKRSIEWGGYKVHITKTCQTDQPHLITHIETTQSTQQDVTILDKLHTELQQKDLLPDDHLLDGAYISADNLVKSSRDYKVNLIGPAREDHSWQALDPEAFGRDQFIIDWEQETMTCPNGKQSRYWKKGKGPRDNPTIQVIFDKKTCLACQDRHKCTRSKHYPRGITLPHQAQFEAMQAARSRQKTQQFNDDYTARSGVEGTISQAVVTMGMRRTRYRGQAKTHLQHLATAAAINLLRIVDWLDEKIRSKTRVSHFARLQLVA